MCQFEMLGLASRAPAAFASDWESIIAFIAGSVNRSNMALIRRVHRVRLCRLWQACISGESFCQGTARLAAAKCHCKLHVGALRC